MHDEEYILSLAAHISQPHQTTLCHIALIYHRKLTLHNGTGVPLSCLMSNNIWDIM